MNIYKSIFYSLALALPLSAAEANISFNYTSSDVTGLLTLNVQTANSINYLGSSDDIALVWDFTVFGNEHFNNLTTEIDPNIGESTRTDQKEFKLTNFQTDSVGNVTAWSLFIENVADRGLLLSRNPDALVNTDGTRVMDINSIEDHDSGLNNTPLSAGSFSVVPVPSSVWFLGTALAGVLARNRWKRSTLQG